MSKGQSSKAAVSTSTQGTKVVRGTTAKAEVTRPRTPTPPPWTPSASSCFSRPEPPPLRAFGGTPRPATSERKVDREVVGSGLLSVPVVANASAGTASPSVAGRDPASAGPSSSRGTSPLHALWSKSPTPVASEVVAAASVVAEPVASEAVAVASEPVVLASVASEAVVESEAAAPAAVELSDSVPVLVLAPSEPCESSLVVEAPRPERTREPAVESMLAVVLQSSIATAKVPRVIVTMPPRREPVAAPLAPRRRLALALGAAAALVLAVGLAASPSASPRSEEDVARDGLSLATNLVEPTSALALEWTSPDARTDATTSQPAPAAPALAALPSPAPDERLALAVAGPVEAVEPALAPAPQPRRARRARHHRSHVPTLAAVESTPEPTPAPRRSSASRRPRPESAKELLFDGEVALRLGDPSEAYRLAKRGRETGAREDAASLVARSACRIGERDEAKQALRDLPLLERGAVRRDCRRSGSRIGL